MATWTRAENQKLLDKYFGAGAVTAGGGGGEQALSTATAAQRSGYLADRRSFEGMENYDFGRPWQQPLQDVIATSVKTPELAAGAEFVPVTQTVQEGELQVAPTISTTAGQIDPTTGEVAPAEDITAAQAQAAQVAAEPIVEGIVAPEVTAQLTTPVEEMEGVTLEPSTLATVKGQFELLMDFEGENYPKWAQGAAAAAQDILAARGLGASSIGAGAITAAITQAAFPIASQDAKTYFQAELTTATNEQQARLENLRVRQQNMLTDTAAKNAAEQFNATSAGQTQQFIASLVANIMDGNANRMTAISKFNAAEENKIAAQNVQNDLLVDQYNSKREIEIKKFNSTLVTEREMFNAKMQFAVDQSNVMWRRSINTANTATVNAAMSANVQNRYNLSATALNNVWQQWRDEASWTFTAMQRQLDRDYNTAMSATNREYNSSDSDIDLWAAAGTAIDILTSF